MPTVEEVRTKLFKTNEYGYEHQDLDAKLELEDIKVLSDKYGLVTAYKDPKTGATVDMHTMCINCQARQLIKYEGAINTRGEKVTGFQLKCGFVPAGLPRGSRTLLNKYILERNMDAQRALRYLKSAIDPVAWCELMFGFDDLDPEWRIRPYQKEQLRCTVLRYVIREGRRSGKTFAMALKLIYLAFNMLKSRGRDAEGNTIYVGPEIIVITPYQAQVANIFNEIENILKRNEDLTQAITTAKGGSLYVKTPYYKLKLSNGATISGFVSGVGTKEDGSGGGTMRGQNADVIYLDEMDMIPEEILQKVIQPLLLTRADVMMIATSTPIGKRGKFYEWCLERYDFKEDYLPSTILPVWEEIKLEVEADNTEEGFAAEYMAHFLEGAYGVFRPSYIYRARGAYKYADSDIHNGDWWHRAAGVKERSELIKVIGIDWNKNAGTEFVVVAYDPSQHHWFVVEANNISASEYSSVRWKEEVVRLNYKWKPDYIYADEGYGHTIIEDLKVEAHAIRVKGATTRLEQETVKLLDRLKAFNFSQKVELKSPVDYRDITKIGKQFLVENTIRVFEEGRIWFPEDDQALLQQLLHYVVLRRHPTTNKPVYGTDRESVGDHRLDALMLALGGLFLEKSMYAPSNIAHSSPSSLTKGFLEQRVDGMNGKLSAAALLQGMNGMAPAVHPTLLEVKRGYSEEENASANRALAAKQVVGANRSGSWFGKRQPKSRGDLGAQGGPDSVYETMMSKASSSAGYSNDREDIYKAREIGSSPSIVKPRVRRISSRRSGARRPRRR